MTDAKNSSACPFVNSEQSPQFLSKGYLLASQLRRRAGEAPDSQTPIRTRALFNPATLVRGVDGVTAFYDTDRMKRAGAMPAAIQAPLFGDGAVHTLDGVEHHTRKNQLADVAYVDEHVDRFAAEVDRELHVMLEDIAASTFTDVHTATAMAYSRAAFAWAGMDLPRDEAERRGWQMTQLLDGFGHVGPSHLTARINRRRLNSWAEQLITETREGKRSPATGTALAAMADLRDPDGELVEAQTAGVELQNLTRPTVAVARFAAFAAVALLEHPEWAERIRAATPGRDTFLGVPEAIAFAQEVRRFYPFVPMLPAIATQDTEISGCPVGGGERVIIDILSTNLDPNHWENPESFDPDRFLTRDDLEVLEDYEKIAAFIPQGGGEVRSGHRCPGEKIAVTALAATVVALSRAEVSLSGTPEDRTFDWTQVLTRPATGVGVTVGR